MGWDIIRQIFLYSTFNNQQNHLRSLIAEYWLSSCKLKVTLKHKSMSTDPLYFGSTVTWKAWLSGRFWRQKSLPKHGDREGKGDDPTCPPPLSFIHKRTSLDRPDADRHCADSAISGPRCRATRFYQRATWGREFLIKGTTSRYRLRLF